MGIYGGSGEQEESDSCRMKKSYLVLFECKPRALPFFFTITRVTARSSGEPMSILSSRYHAFSPRPRISAWILVTIYCNVFAKASPKNHLAGHHYSCGLSLDQAARTAGLNSKTIHGDRESKCFQNSANIN